MYQIISVVMIWILCLLSVFLHETGHALGYRMSTGKTGWTVIAGSGPGLVSLPKTVFRLVPVGGYFRPEEEAETKKEKLMMLAGGPFVSLLLTVLFGIARSRIAGAAPSESGFRGILPGISAFMTYFNFFQLFFTAVPVRYRIICRGSESDGLQIVRVLKRKDG